MTEHPPVLGWHVGVPVGWFQLLERRPDGLRGSCGQPGAKKTRVAVRAYYEYVSMGPRDWHGSSRRVYWGGKQRIASATSRWAAAGLPLGVLRSGSGGSSGGSDGSSDGTHT